jgi:hypothetical protein
VTEERAPDREKVTPQTGTPHAEASPPPGSVDPRGCGIALAELSAVSANVSGVRRLPPLILALAAVAVLGAASISSTRPALAATARSCTVQAAPASLGGTLLRVHQEYMRHQPDVHHPKISGPVGPVHLGRCGSQRFALASFNARYNGFYFGIEDQPERFIELPHQPWKDIGNTGGDPCGSAPTALLVAWKVVRSCP